MTRRELKKQVIAITIFYIFFSVLGVLAYIFSGRSALNLYQLFKDLIPLIIAIPASYLGFCFQRRSSFQQTLRQVWSSLVLSINSAILYTDLPTPTNEKYFEILLMLSKSIDELRGVYKNIGENSQNGGLYPFERLKEIHKLISRLEPGKYDMARANIVKKEIYRCWKELRVTFLDEFDRSQPTTFDSTYSIR